MNRCIALATSALREVLKKKIVDRALEPSHRTDTLMTQDEILHERNPSERIKADCRRTSDWNSMNEVYLNSDDIDAVIAIAMEDVLHSRNYFDLTYAMASNDNMEHKKADMNSEILLQSYLIFELKHLQLSVKRDLSALHLAFNILSLRNGCGSNFCIIESNSSACEEERNNLMNSRYEKKRQSILKSTMLSLYDGISQKEVLSATELGFILQSRITPTQDICIFVNSITFTAAPRDLETSFPSLQGLIEAFGKAFKSTHTETNESRYV